ncbi:MAG: GNAT family N-acetyltransferase [Alphaproteobacteria bacterium]|nr:GNAT family N-acetyltransferase [Alphaproteobacteria bacterium]
MAPTEPDNGCFSLGEGWRGEPLTTQRLRLRLPEPKDAPEIARLAGAAEVATMTASIPHPYPPEAALAAIGLAQRRAAAGEEYRLVIERLADGAMVGMAGFTLEANGRGMLGYFVGREHWGRGYATEAARRLLRLAFGPARRESLQACVIQGNDASVRVLDKLGFAFSHEATAHLPARGAAPIPVVDFTLAALDWRARHAARPMVLVAAAALVDADGRVLIARRPEGRPMAGLWEFPGGKVHPGETPEQALIRELDEELGIDVRDSCLAPLAFASHDYDDFHLLMPLYVCRTWRGDPTPREGQRLAWVRANRLAQNPMPPADLPLAAILRDWL